jgi:concanavalin A-like lectin/glucanase superfamily protein
MLIDPYRGHDEDFLETFMLLHCENGQLYERTGFPVVSVVGGGAVSTSQAKFGTQSFSNPGTSVESQNYVSVIGAPTDFTFPGEFTIEGWFYTRSITDSFMNLFANNINFPGAGFIQLAIRPGGQLFWNSSPGSSGGTSSNVPLNQWSHLAVSRDASDTFRMFIDGVLGFSGTKTGTIGGANLGVSTFDVGRGHASDNGDFDGFFEEIRVTKACRYTANFTPPVTVFPPFP